MPVVCRLLKGSTPSAASGSSLAVALKPCQQHDCNYFIPSSAQAKEQPHVAGKVLLTTGRNSAGLSHGAKHNCSKVMASTKDEMWAKEILDGLSLSYHMHCCCPETQLL